MTGNESHEAIRDALTALEDVRAVDVNEEAHGLLQEIVRSLRSLESETCPEPDYELDDDDRAEMPGVPIEGSNVPYEEREAYLKLRDQKFHKLSTYVDVLHSTPANGYESILRINRKAETGFDEDEAQETIRDLWEVDLVDVKGDTVKLTDLGTALIEYVDDHEMEADV